ncbi:MAG: methyltransferase domain-containing protein [Bacteroidia bacterium]|nr:methyltransferase domain-containing protein [Bacteroidia bacterium]MCZ2249067.1 class I SAM-dependent methyltransferase [Bacteroidia bacterium]
MKLFNSFNIPVDTPTAQRFEKASISLESKLVNINIDKLPVSDYTKKYFKDYQRKLRYSLQACSYILMHALHQSGKRIDEISIVDYGAGTGVLAMLAQEVGFAHVIYNDIYDISCRDAAIIAENAQAKAQDYVCGEMIDLVNFFKQRSFNCDIIVSRNVVEHIYDLEDHFKALSKIPSQKLTLFYATTANNHNPLTVWFTQRIQKRLEHEGMSNKWGKERDSLKAYKQMRQEIIQSHFPEIKSKDLLQLVKLSRGMVKDEIIKTVELFKNSGRYPDLKVKGKNTCDPYTGNWAEHLLDLEEYKNLFQKNGFDFKVVNGFYNTNYQNKVFNLITPLVNFIIRKSNLMGLHLAPFIGLEGTSKKEI